MKTMGTAALAAGLALAAGQAWGQALPAPIAQASQGKVQCYQPNAAAKTCRSIASYQRTAAGEIANSAVTLLAPQPVITLATTTKVTT